MNLPSSSQIDIDLDNQWTSRLPGCVEENGGRSHGQKCFYDKLLIGKVESRSNSESQQRMMAVFVLS